MADALTSKGFPQRMQASLCLQIDISLPVMMLCVFVWDLFRCAYMECVYLDLVCFVVVGQSSVLRFFLYCFHFGFFGVVSLTKPHRTLLSLIPQR